MTDNSTDIIYAPPVDSEEHKKLLEYANDLIKAAEDKHKLRIPQWIDNYNAFLTEPTSRTPNRVNDWQADVRTPYIAEQIFTLLPRIVEGRPTVDILKAKPNVTEESLRAQKQYAKHTMWKDNFSFKSSLWGLNNLLFGVGWSKQSWLKQSRNRSWRDRNTGELHNSKIVTANRATMMIGHPFDVMPDPLAHTLDDARFVVWRTVTSVQQVKNAARKEVKEKDGSTSYVGMYYNTEHVKSCDTSERSSRLIDETTGSYAEYLNNNTNKKVEILEIFDNERDVLIVVANRKIILRCHTMPWQHGQMPVSAIITTPSIGSLVGYSETEFMVPLQEHMHLIENRRLDNTLLQMDSILLIRENIYDKDDWQLAPGAKWPVRDPSDVTPLQFSQQQFFSEQELGALRARIQAVAGSGYMNGSNDLAQDTASGLMSIIEEGNRRVDYRMNLARLGYERALQQMISLGAQYLEDVIYVPGDSRSKDPIPVSPDDLGQDTHVRVTLGSETGMKSLRQQSAQNLMMASQSLFNIPIPTSDGVKSFNPYPIIESLADAHDKDPQDFLVDMQMLQQATAPTDPIAQMAAQQEQGANAGVVF